MTELKDHLNEHGNLSGPIPEGYKYYDDSAAAIPLKKHGIEYASRMHGWRGKGRRWISPIIRGIVVSIEHAPLIDKYLAELSIRREKREERAARKREQELAEKQRFAEVIRKVYPELL